MHKKIKNSEKTQSFKEFEKLNISYTPVNKNGWWIKYSILKDETILFFYVSTFTGQTIIRYFNNEDQAVKFLNFITHCDPTEKFVF